MQKVCHSPRGGGGGQKPDKIWYGGMWFNSKSDVKPPRIIFTWQKKVCHQIDKCRQPVMTDLQVQWTQHDRNSPPPIQAPSEIRTLFNGSRLVVYGFVPHCQMVSAISHSFLLWQFQLWSSFLLTEKLNVVGIAQGFLIFAYFPPTRIFKNQEFQNQC